MLNSRRKICVLVFADFNLNRPFIVTENCNLESVIRICLNLVQKNMSSDLCHG